MKRLINKVSSVFDGMGQCAALLKPDFSIVWTNDESVFYSAGFTQLVDDKLKNARIETETGFSFSENSLIFLLRISPMYEKGMLSGYVCKAETRTELCALIDQSGMLPAKLINVLRSNINHIISISHLLSDRIENRENSVEYGLLQRQIRYGENILLQYINLAELVDEDELNGNRDELDITGLCEKICEKAQIELADMKRRINCCWSAETCYVRVNHVKVSMMILNLLQNALKYSPKESSINFELSSDEHNVYISCSNSVEAADDGAEPTSHLSIPVIRKIANEIGGNCEVKQDEKTYTFSIKLPTIPHENLTLSSSRTSYEADDKLIKLFMSTVKDLSETD